MSAAAVEAAALVLVGVVDYVITALGEARARRLFDERIAILAARIEADRAAAVKFDAP